MKKIYLLIWAIVGIMFIFTQISLYTEKIEMTELHESSVAESYDISRITPLIKEKEEDDKEDEIEEEINNKENVIAYTPHLQINHERLKKENSDYIGWIYIPDTKISYPIVKGPNNDYYLHRTFERKSAYAGSIFIDSFSENGLDQKNVILYGHNMKNGTMFGTLKQYRDKEFFLNHPYIEVYTEEKFYLYEIFAAREVSSDINTLNYQLDNFEIDEYISNAKNTSIHFKENLTSSQIITLSTCMNNDALRFIINGIRIY